MARSWESISRELLEAKPETYRRYPRGSVESPAAAGLHFGLGLPRGQLADWRKPLGRCRGLHVWEFPGYFEAHVDSPDPECDPLAHLSTDEPWMIVAGGALAGAIFGRTMGARTALRSAAGGALLGLLALALLPSE